MANFKVNKTVTATFTYMDLIRLANALDIKSKDDVKRLGSVMNGTLELQETIQEMLEAVSN